MSRLHDAVSKRDINRVKEYLAAGDDINTLDKYGEAILLKVVESACLEDAFEILKLLLDNKKIDINHATLRGGWTALHAAFANCQGYVSFNDPEREKRAVEENAYTKAIDLLIAHGAKPFKDFRGRTPLMCVIRSPGHYGFIYAIIDRYSAFEAKHFGVPAEDYKKEFMRLAMYGFVGSGDNTVPRFDYLDAFWKAIDVLATVPKKPEVSVFSPEEQVGAEAPKDNIERPDPGKH